MRIKNTPEDFGLVTKLFHWFIAVSIIALIWLGWYMVDLGYYDRWYNKSLEWHRALGMLVLGAALLKFGWQLYSPLPDTAARLPRWEQWGAKIVHHLLLAMMILIPVSGYLISISSGKGVNIFGWFDFPALLPVSKGLRDLAIDLHYYLAYGTLVLVTGHAAAALKHQFFNRDSTLVRMLWR